VQRKLMLLDAAPRLQDLAVPAGNRLELLTGDRTGRHSIRANDQYRIMFRWENGNAYEVRVEDLSLENTIRSVEAQVRAHRRRQDRACRLGV
jgi:proteic killer suppression protein